MTPPRRDVYRRVAELHAVNISQGFLSSLGVSFLTLLYKAIDSSPAGILRTAERDRRVIGFVAGSTDTRAIFLSLLLHTPRVAVALLPVLFSPRRLRRLFESFLTAMRKPKLPDVPAAELLSIAVDPEFRGGCVAETLYAELSADLRSRRIAAFRILVGERLSPAHSFYLRMGAKPVGSIEAHHGERSIIYTQTLEAAASPEQ